MIAPETLSSLTALCARMDGQRRLSREDIARLSNARFGEIWPAMASGATFGEANAGVLGFLASPDATDSLARIEHDLDAQISIVDGMFTEYLAHGDIPAPHYAMRIAILLSKAKAKEQEADFLRGWCKHFGRVRNGGNYSKLAERARKLGVYK